MNKLFSLLIIPIIYGDAQSKQKTITKMEKYTWEGLKRRKSLSGLKMISLDFHSPGSIQCDGVYKW